jgi:L-threonylcarbamoyladenylate synthase
MRILPATHEGLAEAARILRSGGLVGMPTETVYGIAANALDAKAVGKTFEVKGRPADNPLIVHVADLEQAEKVAQEVSEKARTLASAFWPGPLTLVLRKSPIVPGVVTAGLDTVAIRVPSHIVARELIQQAGVPVSAPSANTFMALSPTSAQDISEEIADKLDGILDGGPCQVGIESTVLDLTVDPPVILRPGAISRDALEAILGCRLAISEAPDPKSPGRYPRHYAPSTPLHIVDRLDLNACGLTFGETASAFQIRMPNEAVGYARELYRSLRLLDCMDHSEIQVESPPQGPEWEAVWDRLRKASSSRRVALDNV